MTGSRIRRALEQRLVETDELRAVGDPFDAYRPLGDGSKALPSRGVLLSQLAPATGDLVRGEEELGSGA